ncbi:MAG: UMP kinase [Acidobacteria bacterium]|nr:UMP kinase [Acidobacteriota bacterium]
MSKGEPKYKRIMLKLSGEALMGKQEFGIDRNVQEAIADEIGAIRELGVEVAIVIGGGNIFRGVSGVTSGMDRVTADHMGMLATVINSLSLQDSLERRGIFTRVISAIEMRAIAEPYIRRRAIRHLEKKRVIIFSAGTGNPFFTTDTAAALRASEIKAEIIFKATQVDGVYDSDPKKNPDAEKFDKISYIDVIEKNLRVMDLTAVSLCRENGTDILVFNIGEKGNIIKACMGEKIGTLITNK